MDIGWTFFGMKFDWFMVLVFLAVIALVIFVVAQRKKGPRRIDENAGDEGED